MVKQRKKPANQFIDKPIIIMDKILPRSPNAKASVGSTLPIGIGLFFVLFILKSISRSYHWFNAPAEPAPRAIAKIPIIDRYGFKTISSR